MPCTNRRCLLPCRRVRKLHFQLQVTIGSYGYEPVELYLIHGVLAFLALLVLHCVVAQVQSRQSSCWTCICVMSTRSLVAH